MERSYVWPALLIGFGLGFLAGMAWTETGQEIGWLYKYQTLIAGILAVLAAGFTIHVQMRQIGEQEKQTRFVLGDAMPTIQAAMIRSENKVNLRITNWNRRALIIDRWELFGRRATCWNLALQGGHMTPEDVQNNLKPKIAEPGEIILHGWENRNQAPYAIQVHIFFEGPPTGQNILLELHGRMVGETVQPYFCPVSVTVHGESAHS